MTVFLQLHISYLHSCISSFVSRMDFPIYFHKLMVIVFSVIIGAIIIETIKNNVKANTQPNKGKPNPEVRRQTAVTALGYRLPKTELYSLKTQGTSDITQCD